jgi:hypothetical protein
VAAWFLRAAPLLQPGNEPGKLGRPDSKPATTPRIRADPGDKAIPLLHKGVFLPPDLQPLNHMRGAVEHRRPGIAGVGIEVFHKHRAVAVVPHCAATGELGRQAHWVANDMEGVASTDRALLPDPRDAVVHDASVKPDQRPVRAGVIQLPGNDFYTLVNVTVVDDEFWVSLSRM